MRGERTGRFFVSALFLGTLARIVSNEGGVNDSLNGSAPPFALDAEEGTGAAAANKGAAAAAGVAVVGPMSSVNIAGLLLVVVVVLAVPSSCPPKAKPKLKVVV